MRDALGHHAIRTWRSDLAMPKRMRNERGSQPDSLIAAPGAIPTPELSPFRKAWRALGAPPSSLTRHDRRADNTFAARGRLQGSSLVLGKWAVVDVTAALFKAGVSVRLPIGEGGEPMTVRARQAWLVADEAPQ